jgi:hypothetical protein
VNKLVKAAGAAPTTAKLVIVWRGASEGAIVTIWTLSSEVLDIEKEVLSDIGSALRDKVNFTQLRKL